MTVYTSPVGIPDMVFINLDMFTVIGTSINENSSCSNTNIYINTMESPLINLFVFTPKYRTDSLQNMCYNNI